MLVDRDEFGTVPASMRRKRRGSTPASRGKSSVLTQLIAYLLDAGQYVRHSRRLVCDGGGIRDVSSLQQQRASLRATRASSHSSVPPCGSTSSTLTLRESCRKHGTSPKVLAPLASAAVMDQDPIRGDGVRSAPRRALAASRSVNSAVVVDVGVASRFASHARGGCEWKPTNRIQSGTYLARLWCRQPNYGSELALCWWAILGSNQ